MKILIVNTIYAPNQIGGAEKSVQSLAEAFVALGLKIMVVCLAKENSDYEFENVSVKALKIKNNYWPFDNENKSSYQKFLWHLKDSRNTSYNEKFKKIINEFKPDILFTNNLSGFSTNIWSIAKDLGVKVVHTIRDYYLQCPKSTKFKNNLNCKSICSDCRALSYIKKKNSQQINYVVGISEYILADHLKMGYFKDLPYKVIYNGFNLKAIKEQKKRNKPLTFGFIGQVKESKGIELLIKVFLKLRNYKWKLLIGGNLDSTYLKHLKSLNNSPDIEYLGYVKSDSFFEKIDILVVPSLWNEPFGRVVLESFVNRKPVLASNMGGLSELLSVNKDFLFDPNLESLTTQIENILSNPNVLDDFNFDQDFINLFSINETVHKYIKVFESVLNKTQ